MPQADVLLHCGDLTNVGGLSSFKKALQMLGCIDAELKLVIAGNHDLELDQVYWNAVCNDENEPENPQDHNQAVYTMTGPLAVKAGVTFLTEGMHSFTLKSGVSFTVYASPYTPGFGDWAFAYEHQQDRFNEAHQVADGTQSIATNPIPDSVDIVMTHGPSQGILDWTPHGNVGCENLLRAIRRAKPIMHCFGHIHESNGLEVTDWKKLAAPPRKNEAIHRYFENEPIKNPYPEPFVWKKGHGDLTLAINAAIMTGDNVPENSPWLISLDLPRLL